MRNPWSIPQLNLVEPELDLPSSPLPSRAPASRAKVSPEERAALIQQYRNNSVPDDIALDNMIRAMKDNADEARQQVNAYQELPAKLDLSPLYAFAESATGRKQSGYQRPETAQDQQMNLAKLRSVVRDADGDVAKLQLQKIVGNDKNELGMLTRVLASGKDEEKREKYLGDKTLSWADKLNKDWHIKKLTEQGFAMEQVDALLDMAKNGNTIAFSDLGPKMAKALGEVGVLTEMDVSRYTTSPQLVRSVKDKWNKLMSGKPSDLTIAEMQLVAQKLSDTANDKIAPIYAKYAKQLSRSTGLSLEEAAYRLDVPMSVFEKKKTKKESTPPAGSKKQMPKAKWDALSPETQALFKDKVEVVP